MSEDSSELHMQQEEPAMIDQIKQLVVQTLDAKGVLSQMKAQIRRHAFEEVLNVQNESGRNPTLADALGKDPDGSTARALAFVVDFLTVHNLESTLAVLQPESGMKGVADRMQLTGGQEVPSGTSVLEALIQSGGMGSLSSSTSAGHSQQRKADPKFDILSRASTAAAGSRPADPFARADAEAAGSAALDSEDDDEMMQTATYRPAGLEMDAPTETAAGDASTTPLNAGKLGPLPSLGKPSTGAGKLDPLPSLASSKQVNAPSSSSPAKSPVQQGVTKEQESSLSPPASEVSEELYESDDFEDEDGDGDSMLSDGKVTGDTNSSQHGASSSMISQDDLSYSDQSANSIASFDMGEDGF